jgi:isocitrate/isopropylmalate dehydrogenase
MLRWLGQEEAAELLMECVENVTESGTQTIDLGGKSKTNDVTNAVCKEIEVVAGKNGEKV